MKIKRYFKLKKGDSLVASNVEKRLFIVKTIAERLKLYKEGDVIQELPNGCCAGFDYKAYYHKSGGTIIYNIATGFIDIIKSPSYYGFNTVFYRKDDCLYEVDTVNRTENKRFYSVGESCFDYTPMAQNRMRFCVITRKTFTHDGTVVQVYSQNIKEAIFDYVIPSRSPENIYVSTDIERGEYIVSIKKYSSRWSGCETLKTFRFEEIFNPVPFKGEYK